MGPKAKILVIEDDPDLRAVLVSELELEGYDVAEAANGRDALQKIERFMPNLILLDMRMPVMNGWDFAREFQRRHDRKARIVVVTAAANPKLHAEAIGADGWLAKPFELNELITVVGDKVRP
jgi:CheY-like chemotaxis protein